MGWRQLLDFLFCNKMYLFNSIQLVQWCTIQITCGPKKFKTVFRAKFDEKYLIMTCAVKHMKFNLILWLAGHIWPTSRMLCIPELVKAPSLECNCDFYHNKNFLDLFTICNDWKLNFKIRTYWIWKWIFYWHNYAFCFA